MTTRYNSQVPHCPTCGQKLKPGKKTIRATKDGVRVLPDGREVDVTRAARNRRRERIWKRDDEQCRQRLSLDGAASPMIGEFGSPREQAFICGALLDLSEAEIHHIHKRSLGRDDRDSNQVTLCREHHRLYESKTQFSKKGG